MDKRKTDFNLKELFTEYSIEDCLIKTQFSEIKIIDAKHSQSILNFELISEIANKLKLSFTIEAESANLCFAYNNAELRDDFKLAFTSSDLLDYIYAVQHSKAYTEKQALLLSNTHEQLIPYPINQDKFWLLVGLGKTLRLTHLMRIFSVDYYSISFPIDGNNSVSLKKNKSDTPFILNNPNERIGKIWINETQYFDNIPIELWEYTIFDKHPIQDWLLNHDEIMLSNENIEFFLNLLALFNKTILVRKEIDTILS